MILTRKTLKDVEDKKPTDDRVKEWYASPKDFCPGNNCQLDVQYQVTDLDPDEQAMLIIRQEWEFKQELSRQNAYQAQLPIEEFLTNGPGEYVLELWIGNDIVAYETLLLLAEGVNYIEHEYAYEVDDEATLQSMSFQDVVYLSIDDQSGSKTYNLCGSKAQLVGVQLVNANYKEHLQYINLRLRQANEDVVNQEVLRGANTLALDSALAIKAGIEIISEFYKGSKAFPKGAKIEYKLQFQINC